MAEDLDLYEKEVQKYFSELSDDSFEDGHCPFIHSTPPQHLNLFTKGSMAVVRCECDFVYNRIQPTQETLDRFYTESKPMDQWANIKRTDKEDVRQTEKFSWIVGYLKNLNPESVLDIGCGTGKFLRMLNRALPKAKLTGVDQNLSSLKESHFNGVEIFHRSIFEYIDTTSDTFEVISLWGVLEHVKDPMGLLARCKRLLKGKNPRIVVCVPNVESEIVQRLWEKTFTFCPQHLWYFSKSTLERAFFQAGFQMHNFHTIESEALPVIKHSRGFDPYKEVPDYFKDQIHSKSLVDHVDYTVIEKNLGYKVVMVGAPR